MSKIETAFGEFEVADEAVIENEPQEPTDPVDPKDADPGDPTDPVEPQEPQEPTDPEDTDPEEEPTELGFDEVVSSLEEQGVLHLNEEEEYEQSPEGMAKMMLDNMANYRKKVENEFKEKYNITSEAEVPEEYYSKLNPEDVKDAEILVRANLETAGYTQEEIDEKVTDLVAGDKLIVEGTRAKRIVAEKEKNYIEGVKETNAKTKKEREDQRTQRVEEFKSDIDATEEIAGFKLDDDKKEAFKDYIFKVGADGKTQAQRNAVDKERRIRLAFLDFMDANKEDFEIKARTEVANKLKKKTSRFKPKAAVRGKSVDRSENNESKGIDMDLVNSWM